MNYDFAEYVGKNREEIFRLFSELTKFQDSIERLVKQVNVIVEGKLKDHKQRLWPEKKEFSAKAVTELRVGKDKNCSLVIDSTIDPSGWKFELFQRTRSEPQIDFRSSLISEELKGKLTKAQNGLETERYLLEGRFPLSAPPQDVASYIVEVINFSSELPWVVRDAAVDSSQTSG